MEETPPLAPGIPPPGVIPPSRPRGSGFLRWGLVGCAGLSLVLIVSLVFLGTKARTLLGWALDQTRTQVLGCCTAEVTPEERRRFEEAFAAFSARTRAASVKPEALGKFRDAMTAAASDGKVTPEELRELTAVAREAAK